MLNLAICDIQQLRVFIQTTKKGSDNLKVAANTSFKMFYPDQRGNFVY